MDSIEDTATTTVTVSVTSAPGGTPGLYARYYWNTFFGAPEGSCVSLRAPVTPGTANLTRIDPEINFLTQFRDYWRPSGFWIYSVIWSGNISISASGTYTFRLDSDDGSWLYLDSNLLVNDSGAHAAAAVTNSTYLSQGIHQIVVYFYETCTDTTAGIDLTWEPPGASSFTVVPSGVLFYSHEPSVAGVSATCAESALRAGQSTVCTATVSGVSPTGVVFWSQTGSGSVSFNFTCTICVQGSLARCSLSSTDQCSVTVTGKYSGSVRLSAAYGGDTNNIGSSGSQVMTTSKTSATLAISCKSTSKDKWTCTATLKGYLGPVKGEKITWTKLSGAGGISFSSSACKLSAGGTCSATVEGTKIGSVTIRALYAGDKSNTDSYAKASLKVT
jgi:hypothetical protein